MVRCLGPGGRGAPGSRGHGPGRGNGGRGSFFRGSNNNGKKDKTPYQVCGKIGHSALDCRYRFDESYTSDYNNAKSVAAATNSYGVDTNWYTDTTATDHITGELDKLITRDKYKGNDQILTANGMDICNIGHAIINTPHCILHLSNVLHVPNASKNLIFVHHFSNDNHASLEYFPNYFFIKDLDMRNALLEGQCKDGLYPIPTS
jgi:hypothetical protein